MYVNKGLISQIFSRSQRQRWTCSPVRQVEYFGVFFMIRWYQSVYSHKYDLAHVVIHTFNSVFITPQAAIRDGFLIRFLTQKRCLCLCLLLLLLFHLLLQKTKQCHDPTDISWSISETLDCVISSHELGNFSTAMSTYFQFPHLHTIRLDHSDLYQIPWKYRNVLCLLPLRTQFPRVLK